MVRLTQNDKLIEQFSFFFTINTIWYSPLITQYQGLKASSQYTCTYAGIEIISIPAYVTHVQIILYAQRRQITQRSLKRIL